jgi:uncharacterized protein YndB with AHSA1/START domain
MTWTTMGEDLRSIRVDQFYPHAPEKVWRALTTPALMAQWLMPNDFRPEVGHAFTFRAQPVTRTGFSGLIACTVLEVNTPHRLRFSWADAADPDAMPTEVCLTLQAEGRGTRLFLEHSGFDPDDPTQQLARQFMNGGWRSHVLRRLGDLLRHVAA